MESTEPKLSTDQRAKLFIRSSLTTLKLDKELLFVPLLNMLGFILLAIPFLVFVISRMSYTRTVDSFEITSQMSSNTTLALGIGFGILSTVLAIIFEGVIIKAALERFRGNDPTIRSTFRSIRSRIGSLVGFGFLSATIGYALQLLEQKVPFAGKIATWIAGAAWSVASMFAVAAIVDNEESTTPIKATKKSVDIVKKAWGVSFVSQIGLGLYVFFVFLIWAVLFGAFIASIIFRYILSGAGVENFQLSAIDIAGGVIGLLSFAAILVVSQVLSSIVKAAVYFYATTGESPAHFDKRLLKEAMTPRKSVKIFSSR